jgi:hypothetical protein
VPLPNAKSFDDAKHVHSPKAEFLPMHNPGFNDWLAAEALGEGGNDLAI